MHNFCKHSLEYCIIVCSYHYYYDEPYYHSLLQVKKYCSRLSRTGEHQALLSSTSTETSGSFGKPKRESVFARVKELIPIMKVFFPITMYWAVSYQRFSSFVLQGVEMDCYLGSIEVPPGTLCTLHTIAIMYYVKGIGQHIQTVFSQSKIPSMIGGCGLGGACGHVKV